MNQGKNNVKLIKSIQSALRGGWLSSSGVSILGLAVLACADGTRVPNGASTPEESEQISTVGIGGAPNNAAPQTLRVLLAATVAGNAGTSSGTGTGGAGGTGGTGGTGATGGAAGSGSAGSTGVSVYCGDGYRDTTKEECDEGFGSPGKFCNWGCQLQDNWPSHTEVTLQPGSRVLRELGRGRHPLAANANRFAVSLVEQITPAEQQVRVAQHGDWGVSLGDTVMSTGTWVADNADPVTAVLSDSSSIVAYTEFGGDGDGLGIALRRLGASASTPDAVQYASVPSFGAQYDPDILALPGRILVAYTDEYDAASGPDITLREFGLDLKAKSTMALGNSTDVEGRVGLAQLGTSWGAAWYRPGTWVTL